MMSQETADKIASGGKKKAAAPTEGTVSGARLKSFLERIERLSEEQTALGEDIRDVYGESKAAGFEPKIIRKIVTLRKQNLEKRREEAELTRLYAAAIRQADLFD